MQAITFDTAAEFLERAEPTLSEREAENNLVIGIAMHVSKVGAGAVFAGVFDGDRLVCASLRTPPRHVLVTRGPDEALRALAHHLADRDRSLPGVFGVEPGAAVFASTFGRATDQTFEQVSRQRGYELRRLIPPKAVPGRFRPANLDDLELLALWHHLFTVDVGIELMNLEAAQVEVKRRIEAGLLFVWEDPLVQTDPFVGNEKGVVSMAALSRPTRTGIAVNFVYTPGPLRGRGYAKACVAALSQRCFDEGREACFLNADLENPVSNHVYLSLGYEPVVDWAMIEFHPRIPAGE